MAYYDNYVNNTLSKGNNTSDQFVNYTQQFYDMTFKKAPNYIKDATWNGNPIDIRVLSINSEKNNLPVDERKKILIRDLSLRVNYGDYMTFWNDTWIIVDKKVSSPASNTCTVERCNFNLKTILPNGKLINFPCSVRKMSKSALNVNVEDEIQTPKMEFFVEVVNNDDTMSVPLSWRLLFGKTAYKITDKQDLVPVGILEFKITSDGERIGKDDFNTGIADNSVQENPIPTGNLIIQGNKSININKTGTYSIVYDNGGNTTGSFTWSLSDNIHATIQSCTGSNCVIKGVKAGQVKLTASDGTNNIPLIINITNYYA